MKKKNLLPVMITIIVCTIVSAGCSKETFVPPPPGHNKYQKAPNFGGFVKDEYKYGSITGTISPIDAQPRVFLSGTASMELTLDSTGKLLLAGIPEGEYELDIIPDNYNYGTYSVSNLFVYVDSVANIGNINLEYYGGGGSGCEIGWGRQK